MGFMLRLMAKAFPSVLGTLRNAVRLARDYGQWRSMRERKPVDAKGAALPWYTYPAIEYLGSFSFKNKDIFEFGAGNSSLFWAHRARSLISVEDNKEWFLYVKGKAAPNHQVIHRESEAEYVNALSEQGRKFHVIVVDGKWRGSCIAESVKHLEAGGMILLDNSDWYPEASRFLRDNGFFQIDFSGFGPMNDYCWTTSIFIEAMTVFQQSFSGPVPIGGIAHQAG